MLGFWLFRFIISFIVYLCAGQGTTYKGMDSLLSGSGYRTLVVSLGSKYLHPSTTSLPPLPTPTPAIFKCVLWGSYVGFCAHVVSTLPTEPSPRCSLVFLPTLI